MLDPRSQLAEHVPAITRKGWNPIDKERGEPHFYLDRHGLRCREVLPKGTLVDAERARELRNVKPTSRDQAA